MTFDRDALLSRKAEIEKAMQEVANEFQRLIGAAQLCDALIAELDASEEKKEDDRINNPE
jgi:hypothetical protein